MAIKKNLSIAMTSKKLLFVIPGLRLGGAERVVSLLANHWSKRGHDVSIITFNNEPSYYFLEKEITVHSLFSARQGFGAAFLNNIVRPVNYFKQMKRRKPDIIISFTDNANVFCVLYNHFLKKPLIITQRTNPYYSTLPRMMQRLPHRIYKNASGMVVQTTDTLKLYEQLQVTLPKKTAVIFNPLSTSFLQKDENNYRENIVLAVGRLNNKDKCYDKLINIFNASPHEGWQLHIAGNGEDEQVLRDQVKRLGLDETVKFLGPVKDVIPLYRRAKIFALTSTFEGFPNALCEAMACGCACISYDCPTGPSAIIKDGENGILIEAGNEALFVKQLSSLMNDEATIQRLSSSAYNIYDLLKEDTIIGKWESFIEEILESHSTS